RSIPPCRRRPSRAINTRAYGLMHRRLYSALVPLRSGECPVIIPSRRTVCLLFFLVSAASVSAQTPSAPPAPEPAAATTIILGRQFLPFTTIGEAIELPLG